LEPVSGMHGRGLELFRTQHRHREISEQGEGDEPDEDGFHGEERA
jgi:hypothetical protein